jgi:urea transport system substrate-binding protein
MNNFEIYRILNEFITGIFVIIIYWVLDKYLDIEGNGICILFILVVLPLLIMRQRVYNTYMNLLSPYTITYYSITAIILCLTGTLIRSGIFIKIVRRIISLFISSKSNRNYTNIEYAAGLAILLIITQIVLRYLRVGSIDVGILHSLTGPMRNDEQFVVNIIESQIEKVNSYGGINGKKLISIVEDGKSNDEAFVKGALSLIESNIKSIFCCVGTNTRKVLKPVVEKNNVLLFNPVPYEGQECSPNIIYTCATPNQHIEVGVDWALKKLYKKFYMIGFEGMPYSKTANRIMKNIIEKNGGNVVGEEYIAAMNETDKLESVIDKIVNSHKNCVILGTLYGPEKINLYKFLYEKSIKKYPNNLVSQIFPVVSFSISETDITNQSDIKYLIGHYSVWNYFQTIDNSINKNFVSEYKSFYGNKAKVSDHMEAGYIGFNLWLRAISNTDNDKDVALIKNNIIEKPYNAPEGEVVVTNSNHTAKYVRIGKINEDGLFDIIFTTLNSIDPIPWNKNIPETSGYVCDHSQVGYGEKFKKVESLENY